jgi:hypothetical protein
MFAVSTIRRFVDPTKFHRKISACPRPQIVPRGTISPAASPKIVPRGTILKLRAEPRQTNRALPNAEIWITYPTPGSNCSTWNNLGTHPFSRLPPCHDPSSSLRGLLSPPLKIVPRGTILRRSRLPGPGSGRMPACEAPEIEAAELNPAQIVPRGTILKRRLSSKSSWLRPRISIRGPDPSLRAKLFHVEQFRPLSPPFLPQRKQDS